MASSQPTSDGLSTPRHSSGRKYHPLICAECSAPFLSVLAQQKCCSKACGWKAGRRNQNLWRAEQAKRRHARVCVECGSAFLMHRPSGKANQGLVHEGQFCSKECAGSGKRWASYVERKRTIKKMKKRATFASREIFERDGWRCLLCDDEVVSTLTYPDQGSPCVTHIVPTSKGGKRSWNNVALAHLTCAVHRRARDRIGR